MFIDKVKIYVKAGNGGNGCVAFHREKYVSHGGPDGGDGGKGGDVVFLLDSGKNTLLDFKYRRKFIADNGEDGKNSKFHGKCAADLCIPLPPGTLIKDPESGKIIKDMSDADVVETGRYVFLKGGKGGFGNIHFANSVRQAPNFAKSGVVGMEAEVILELKMLADAGLVGMPNAGKSTILSMMSRANPKIADYPFTTLSPMLGVVENEIRNFVLADIPGLIEGASRGEGLGHEFLRHVDRCGILINVVDASGYEGRDPIDDIIKINRELELYSPTLAARPRIIAANKTDMMSDETRERLQKYADEHSQKIVFLCAGIGDGIDELACEIAKMLGTVSSQKVYEPEITLEEMTLSDDDGINVYKDGDVFVVEAKRIINVVNSVNFTDRESLAYFQKILKKTGIIAKLEENGIVEGDTVRIYGAEFDYYK